MHAGQDATHMCVVGWDRGWLSQYTTYKCYTLDSQTLPILPSIMPCFFLDSGCLIRSRQTAIIPCLNSLATNLHSLCAARTSNRCIYQLADCTDRVAFGCAALRINLLHTVSAS